MVIQQAVYGVSTGHALLKSSDEALSKEFNNAAWRTDLPATCPFGVTWAPFFRLVRLEGWMLFVHTRPDAGAERGGMVFSRAALIPIRDVASLNDLCEIAVVLQQPWSPNDPLPPISVTGSSGDDGSPEVADLTTAVARALLRDMTRPVVVVQQDSFDSAVFQLWRRVPPEFRSKLTFGLSFGPEDVHELAVVSTPKALVSRWDPSQIVSAEPGAAIDGSVATILDLQINSSVRKFAKRMALPLDSPKAIAIAMRAWELWGVESTPSGDVQLLRILTERAGTGEEPSVARTVVAKRLAAAVPSWAALDVLSMRNLDIASLKEAELLAGALTSWTQHRSVSATPESFLDVLTSWASEKPTQAWRDGVEAGLRAVLADKRGAENIFALIWRAITEVSSRSKRLLSLLDGLPHEKRLTACVDCNLSQSVADQILPAAVSKDWWQLAGTLLARSRSPSEALKAALFVAPSAKSSRKTLVASSLSEATATELADAAIASHDAVAMQLAAEACGKTPSVLRKFDWKRYEWFQLFKGAYDISPSVLCELPDRVAGIGQTIAAQMAVDAIWQAVAHTPLADLADAPGRERAWDLIPAGLVERILDVTARSWLRKFEQGQRLATDLEPRLAVAVSMIAKQPGYLIDALRREPASLPLYLAAFCFDTDRDAFRFLGDLKDSDLRLAEASSRALGRTLVVNGWHAAGRDAVKWLHSRHDFQAMYRECNSLLSPLDRLWVTFMLGLPSPLSMEEAWEVFGTEAANLYPTGPWHNEIWSRSGGHNEDLVHEGSGKASWHRCMRDLRNGIHPGAEALLREMMNNFPNNNTLRQLEQQRFWR